LKKEKRKIAENKEKYGLSKQEILDVVVPVLQPTGGTDTAKTAQKIKLKQYRQTLIIMQQRLEELKRQADPKYIRESKCENSSSSESTTKEDKKKKSTKSNIKRPLSSKPKRSTKKVYYDEDSDGIDDLEFEDEEIGFYDSFEDYDEIFEAPRKRPRAASNKARSRIDETIEAEA